MNLTQDGIDLIKRFEGFSPTQYLDPVGIPTIGYGHVILPGEHFNEITEQQATDLLVSDAATKRYWITYYIQQPLNDNQYSALISLVFNLGVTPLTATLGKMLNEGDINGAANQFTRWIFGRVDGKEQILPGLVKRRAAEKMLFLKPIT